MINKKKAIKFNMILILIVLFTACSNNINAVSGNIEKSVGEIYLYGEQHGDKGILDKELEIWKDYYNNQNMRHMFVELPYYTTEYLNIWMKSDNDIILDKIYNDWENTAIHKTEVKEFYKRIKEICPNTIFHGTDVGHQYYSTGKDYIEYLKKHGLESSEKYERTLRVINQGKKYYETSDSAYRENMMVKNFIFEFDKLKDESIMGIYGNAHIGLDNNDVSDTVPSMANQLNKYYNGMLYLENLDSTNDNIDPLKEESININGKEYTLLYFGKEDLDGFKDYDYREFWRIENAYEDFKYNTKIDNVLPYNEYIMKVDEKEVYIIDYTKKDGSVNRVYYRSDGEKWNGLKVTEEFILDK